MTRSVYILNGPNLNLLGIREPHIYGTTTLADIEDSCRAFAEHLGVDLFFRQSNHEGELVDWVQSAREKASALLMNPAGFSFTSIALLDALKTFDGPKIEVHISNIHARDELHRHSLLSGAMNAVICGLGPYGYIVGIQAAVQILEKLPAGFPATLRKQSH
jgi:3-dehydroquinate dehydratase-2